ncbi:MAG TPA: DUF222 domain-containing protein, partial [Pseudonocardiaceae bacterium]|nr:DUF222 domain-containing protein [Pseudonocardiaceae bacterium]
ATAVTGSAAPSPARFSSLTGTGPARSCLTGTADRAAQAQDLRATLDAAADLINTQHAQVLSAVIAMKEQNLHRSAFGFSALRDLLLSQFDFTFNTAGAIAAIARLSGKFRVLTAAAVSGAARIDQVAYAVRQLDQTPAMRLFAKTPFRTPVPSPFDPDVRCATPEAMVAQYCQHAPFKDLRRHLEELWAAISEEAELLDGLGEQSLQRLDLVETGSGMWRLEADLTAATGRLLDKYLKTACPPPRQDETDTDGVLPPQANRHAEALHQLLAGYGTSPEAATRHGHTATLDLTVDIQTLRGEDTGRTPLLEGRPISLAQARLLACEAGVVPSVFDYQAGEAVELGRALRLPNTALRRKLELEQPSGCAWTGCDRPVAWTEAHHIVHWADGGPTNAANLILLCRFHHGRIHTNGWTVTKTGPGTAVITHHDHDTAETGAAGRNGRESAPADSGCGCADWRTDADMDAANRAAEWDLFPTGLYRTECSDMLKPDLNGYADLIESDRAVNAMRAAKAQARQRFQTEQTQRAERAKRTEQAEQAASAETLTPATLAAPVIETSREATLPKAPALAEPAGRVRTVGPVDYGEPPFLGCPSGRPLGEARPPHTTERHAARTPPGAGLLSMSTVGSHPTSEATHSAPRRRPPEPRPSTTPRPQTPPEVSPPLCRC